MGESRLMRMQRASAMLMDAPLKPAPVPEAPLQDPLDLVKEILLSNTTYPDTMTLGELRTTLLKKMVRGVRCPLCARRVVLRVRPLSYPIVKALHWLVAASGDKRQWVHVPTEAPAWFLRTRQHSALSLWGLAETMVVRSASTPGAGTWRPTKKGLAFAQGTLKVPSKSVTYNSKLLGFAGDLVVVTDIQAMPSDLLEDAGIPQGVSVSMPEKTTGKE